MRAVQVDEASAERLQLEAQLRTGVEGLIHLVEGDDILLPPANASEPVIFRSHDEPAPMSLI